MWGWVNVMPGITVLMIMFVFIWSETASAKIRIMSYSLAADQYRDDTDKKLMIGIWHINLGL